MDYIAVRPTTEQSALAVLDDNARREYWAALALRCTAGLGIHSVCALLKCFGSAWDSLQNMDSWWKAGVENDAVLACRSEEWRRAARPEWDAAKKLKGYIILWTDPRYPRELKEIDDAPALLYAVGDLSLLNAPRVAVVGSRKASQAAMDFTSSASEELSSAGIAVVSGMAFGVDACAHRAALRRPGRTIAVLAGGVDVVYPARHEELYRRIASQGLVISELPPGTKPGHGAFPVRNRIVSGLSLGVLMVEADSEKSGSLITARLAAEQGRGVYVPAPDAMKGEYREGSRYLLTSGAFPVWRAGDLMADLFPHLAHALRRSEEEHVSESEKSVVARHERKQKDEGHPAPVRSSVAQRPVLPPDESFLMELLSVSPLSPDDLLLAAQERDASWGAPRLLAALMMLEVKKLVRRLSDSRYEVRL